MHGKTEGTPLLSWKQAKKNVPGKLMVPPNYLGQMVNFGTSFKKIQLGLSEKIEFEV